MSDKEKQQGKGLKSAYEMALERLDSQGIERPREGRLDETAREKIAEARRRAEAALAEAEILHRDTMASIRDPELRRKAEEEYRIDRRRIEERLEREVREARGE